jgi:hypothetical protein
MTGVSSSHMCEAVGTVHLTSVPALACMIDLRTIRELVDELYIGDPAACSFAAQSP